MIRWLALLLATSAFGQEMTLEGDYHFVQLQIREAAKSPEVTSAAGTLNFSANGTVQAKMRMARGKAAMTPLPFQGKWQSKGGGAYALTNPADAKGLLDLRASQGVLIGASQSPQDHVFFVALRAPQGAVAVPPKGRYKAAWFALPGANPMEAATGLLDLSFGENTAVTQAELLVHSSSFDDVTHKEPLRDVRFTLGAQGAGEFHAGAGSEWLTGKRELLASQDGGIVLGFSSGPNMRDVLVAIRPEQVPSNMSWMGAYWMTELSAEAAYEFHSGMPSISSGFGTLVNKGAGTADINERIFSGARERRLYTVNAYRMGTDGSSMLGRKFSTTVNNFATGGQPPVFISVQLAGENELSLEHGIGFGLRMPDGVTPEAVEAPVFTHADGAPIDGARPAKPGQQLELKVKDAAAGPVEVWIAGQPCEVKRAGKILVTVPAMKLPGTHPVAVSAGHALYDLSTLYVVP